MRDADGRIAAACIRSSGFPHRRQRHRRPARGDRARAGRPRPRSSPRPSRPRATPATRRAASPRRSAPTTAPALHAADTMRAGDGLCDEAAVRVLVEEGPRVRRASCSTGARASIATRTAGLALGREAAHSVRRVLHAGDATGREIGRVLWERVRALPVGRDRSTTRSSPTLARRRRPASSASGSSTATARAARSRARATLLATGGAGQVFRETTNPAVATGDGDRARVSRRRARRRSRVRAVSSDRAERARARRAS